MTGTVIEFPSIGKEIDAAVASADEALRQLDRPGRDDFADVALKFLDLCLQIYPNDAALLFRKAIAQKYLGLTGEAIDTYGVMIGLDEPPSKEFEGRVRARRSELLRQLGRFAEALPDSKKAVELCPDVPEVMLEHARALAYSGQGDDAIDAYDDIIESAETLNFEHAVIGIDAIISERDAIVRLFLESDVV
jgi:tetratricopeptide (TPR) repeat protein